MEAIHEACVQVLLTAGVDRLTTTQVAERAGVSVGSLYQYFPNKQALVASVLERHLEAVVVAVEAACLRTRGEPVEAIGGAVVRAFLRAKLAQRDASAALYAAAAFVDGAAIVQRQSTRACGALAQALATAGGPRPRDPALAALVLTGALAGPVQMLLAAPATERWLAQTIPAELERLAIAYLRETVSP